MRRILFILLAATLSAGWAYASATATATTAAPAGDDTDESDLKYSDDETDYWYAIFNAASRLARDGYTPLPEIEIPLTISLAEMVTVERRAFRVSCQESLRERKA